MIPKSIAIIPDGNRRLARRLGRDPWKGHEWGVRKLYRVLEWCREAGIQRVTFYALSLENLRRRPKQELQFLFALARSELDAILSDRAHFIHRNKVRLTFFGCLHLLPRDLREKIGQVAEATRKYRHYRAHIALAYGGRQEILDAATRLAQARERATEQSFRKHLQTNGAGDPDLIIRTGGEQRLSNFLLFQSAYSELAFLKTSWPALTRRQFLRAIQNFSLRERRFGK